MSPQDQETTVTPSKWSDANIVPLLSLKLLLLAFFILLNARSDLETLKVDAVLESVKRAFNGQVVVATNLSTQSAAAGPMETTTLALNAVGELFEAMLPAVQRTQSPRGPLMSLELSAGSFFLTGEAALRRGRDGILDRLVQTLLLQGQAYDYEIWFLHARDPVLRGLPALAGARLQAMADALAARGLPVERLHVGLFEEARERVRLVIRMTALPAAPPATEASVPGAPGQAGRQ